MMTTYKRTHPCTIFTRLKLSVILILIPVLQQILYRPQELFEIIGALSLNTLYAIGVVTYAVYSYRQYMYRLIPRGIEVKRGLIFSRHFMLPFEKIQTVNIYQNIFASALGAYRISFDSPGGTSRKYDISAYIAKSKARALVAKIHPQTLSARCYRGGRVSVLLMCAFWSNPAVGLLFAAPFVSQMGKTISSEIQDMLLGYMNTFWRNVIRDISPAAAMIANVLLVGWVIAFFLQLARYGKFYSGRNGDYLMISRGLINRSITYTRADRIAAVTIDQSLVMKLLNLYSAGIFTIGSGKIKGDKGLILLADKKRRLQYRLRKIVHFSDEETQSLYPAKHTLYSYICLPLWITVTVMGLLVLADWFSVINEIFKILMIFSIIPLMWWILFRVFAHRHARLAHNDGFLIVNGYDKLTMKKYIIPYSQVQYIAVTQSIFQKRKHTCTVSVYMYYEKKACCKVKHLSLQKAEKIVQSVQ